MTEFGEELKGGAFADTHPSVEKRNTEFNLNFSTKFARDRFANSGPKCLFILIESFQTEREAMAAIKSDSDNDDDRNRTVSVPKWLFHVPWVEKAPLMHFFKKKKRKIKTILHGLQRYEPKGERNQNLIHNLDVSLVARTGFTWI